MHDLDSGDISLVPAASTPVHDYERRTQPPGRFIHIHMTPYVERWTPSPLARVARVSGVGCGGRGQVDSHVASLGIPTSLKGPRTGSFSGPTVKNILRSLTVTIRWCERAALWCGAIRSQ